MPTEIKFIKDYQGITVKDNSDEYSADVVFTVENNGDVVLRHEGENRITAKAQDLVDQGVCQWVE